MTQLAQPRSHNCWCWCRCWSNWRPHESKHTTITINRTVRGRGAWAYLSALFQHTFNCLNLPSSVVRVKPQPTRVSVKKGHFQGKREPPSHTLKLSCCICNLHLPVKSEEQKFAERTEEETEESVKKEWAPWCNWDLGLTFFVVV